MFRFFKRKPDTDIPPDRPVENDYISRNVERKYQKIKANHLKVGMFVSELDRPWAETPFAIQGFHIYREADIDEIKKYSEYVYIDILESSIHGKVGLGDIGSLNPREVNKFPDKESWTKEQHTYDRVTQLTFGLLDKIALDSGESSQTVRSIIDSCVDSVISNPYALALISQMQRVSADLESHSIACCALATSFGRFLGMDSLELEKLALGALLHDVGMLKLPTGIVQSKGHFSLEQYDLARTHTKNGGDVLTSNEYYWPAIDVAIAHHERVDGDGYPRKLAGSAIPYNARIVAIVDVYDRLTSPDSYRQPVLSPTSAMGEIYDNKGTQFDAQLVEKFIRFMGVYPLGTPVELNTGEIAVVVEKNPFYMVLPKVLVVMSGDGTKITPYAVDLFKEKEREEGDKIEIVKTLSMKEEYGNLLKEAALYSK